MPRPETFTLAATLLAAISAAFSAYSAFRQERATFTSVLYGKQIEEVAKFHDIAQKAISIVMSNSGILSHKTDAGLTDIRHVVDELSPVNEIMERDLETLRIVVPQGYAESAEKIAHRVAFIEATWEGVSSNVLINKISNLWKIRDDWNITKIANDDWHGSFIEQLQLDAFRQCTYSQLKEGRTLSDNYADRCVFPP
jgi:hypothetical protein